MSMPFGNNQVWRERAPLPLPRTGYIGGVVNGFYVVGGGSYWVDNKKILTSRVDVFDPHENAWSMVAPLPEPRSDAASVTVRNRLYAFGGLVDSRSRADALVLSGAVWRAIPEATLPEPRYYATAVALGEAIYLIGGMPMVGDYMSARNTLWRWDTASDTKEWEILPSFPGPGLILHAAAVVGRKIYVLGGAEGRTNRVANSSAAYEFDCGTRRWARLPDLSVARRCWWAVPFAETVLLVGGYSSAYEDEVLEYDLRSHTLRSAGTLPRGICDAKFFKVGDFVIGAGGEAGDKIRGDSIFELRIRP